MLHARHFALPIGKTRLYSSIFIAFASGFFIFLASTNYGWFTLTRQMYFAFGVVAGLILGIIETRIVIPRLVKDAEAFVWQVVPIGIALFGLPLLLVIAVFGVTEYLPFGVYAFFPFITASGAASGFYFSKFERKNQVGIFMFYYGFKYWKYPDPDINERFHQFLKDVKSKDPSQFGGGKGSSLGYIGYSKIFMAKLKEEQEIDPSTREGLMKLLITMNRYRNVGLTLFALFLVSVAALVILLFGSTSGYIHLNFKITDLGPIPGIICFGFLIGALLVMKMFQRKISRLLES